MADPVPPETTCQDQDSASAGPLPPPPPGQVPEPDWQALAHLGLLGQLRGSGPQRRGPCPVHGHPGDRERTFSVHLGKGAFRCFQADCGAQGNALDLWAAIHRLPLYDAALHLAATFRLRRNREEEPVPGTR